MPRGYDSHQPKADWSPLQSKLNFDTGALQGQVAQAYSTAIHDWFQNTVDAFLQEVDSDITTWFTDTGRFVVDMVDGLANAWTNLFGAGNDPSSDTIQPGTIPGIDASKVISGRFGAESIGPIPVQQIQPINPAASTLVSVTSSGDGDINSGFGTAAISWVGSKAIATTDDYAVVIVNCATTAGKGATCTMIVNDVPFEMLQLTALGGFGASNAPTLTFFGLPLTSAMAGEPTFNVAAVENDSVVTLLEATSMLLSGVGSLEDIVMRNFGVDEDPTLTTEFAVPGSVVVQAFASFAASSDDPTLTNYTINGATQTPLYHPAQTVSGNLGFQADLIVSAVSNPSAPAFGATMAGKTRRTSFGSIAIVFNPTAQIGKDLGAGFRRARKALTPAVSVVSGNQILPATFFDTDDDTTDYLIYNPTVNGVVMTGAVQVVYVGRYSISLQALEQSTGTYHNARMLLYRFGSIIRKGPATIVSSRATGTYAVAGNWTNVYLNAGDILQPGIWSSKAVNNVLVGTADGAETFWEISLTSRGLL